MQRMAELENSNAMWGWIAGGIVLALLMLFIFGGGPNTTDVARNANGIPPVTTSTGMAPPRDASPSTPLPPARPAPSTTGQGGSPQ